MPAPVLQTFLEKGTTPSRVDYILFGAPLDKTASNRRGTRFGPDAIRRESIFLDTYSTRTQLDYDDLSLTDIGNIECKDVETTFTEIQKTIQNNKGTPVMLGGEHTITLGALRALNPELVIVFDAHLDLRDELFDDKMCHATYLRRGYEEQGFKAIIVGARALSKEEVEFIRETPNLCYVSAQKILREGPETTIKVIRKQIEEAETVYMSIDLDVLDPSYAPAVGNPHPEGISTTKLLDIIEGIMDEKFVGFDLNEVYPHYDHGNTATTAAYIVMETLYAHVKAKKAV